MSEIFDSAMKVINDNFLKLYESDSHIISVFVVGSMAMKPYTERKYNDYDIRCIVDEFVPQTFENVNKTIEDCIDYFKDDHRIGIAFSDLVGPVNHHVTNNEHNILIHSMVHTIDDLTDFLLLTHKYMYGNGCYMVCGRDILSELSLRDTRYSLNDIIKGYEGIDYCIEMIKNCVHRYSRYEVVDGKCVFISYEVEADIAIQHENCFYSTLKNIGNLRNYDYFSGEDICDSLFDYGKRILGEVGYNNFNLLDVLLKKDENRLEKEYTNFNELTLELLEHLRSYISKRISN